MRRSVQLPHLFFKSGIDEWGTGWTTHDLSSSGHLRPRVRIPRPPPRRLLPRSRCLRASQPRRYGPEEARRNRDGCRGIAQGEGRPHRVVVGREGGEDSTAQ
jgi:hypothetical protein